MDGKNYGIYIMIKLLRMSIYLLTISIAFSDPFEFESSTQQSAYFFMTVTINDEEISSQDWVGAFCNDICVGGKQWDTNNCGNGVCDIVAMGDDGFGLTEGYCTPGDIITFKIFDNSVSF